MSHFVVMVVTENGTEEELNKALLPYHEYECTGIKEFTEFVDCTEEVLKEWETGTEDVWRNKLTGLFSDYTTYVDLTPEEKNLVESGQLKIPYMQTIPRGSELIMQKPDTELFERVTLPRKEVYADLDEFAESYFGYERNEDGKIGTITNPNAKWDYWRVGGRWSNMLLSKDGEEGDSFRKKDIDLQALETEARENRFKHLQEFVERMKLPSLDYLKQVWKENYEFAIKISNEWSEKYQNKEITSTRSDWIKENYPNQAEACGLVLNWFLGLEKEPDLDVYLNKPYYPSFYALVDVNGKWHAEGEMGWFGISNNDDPNWEEIKVKLWESIDDNHFVTMVDCHI